MTLWSCKVKKEDKVGAGPQKMPVYLSLIEQYAGQSNTKWFSSSAVSKAQTRQKRCSLSTLCATGFKWPVSTWRPWQPHLNLLTSLRLLNFSVRKGKGPAHSLGVVFAASADTCLRYGQPGEMSVGKEFWHCQWPYWHISHPRYDDDLTRLQQSKTCLQTSIFWGQKATSLSTEDLH